MDILTRENSACCVDTEFLGTLAGRFVQPGERETEGRSHHDLQLPHEGKQRGRHRSLLSMTSEGT